MSVVGEGFESDDVVLGANVELLGVVSQSDLALIDERRDGVSASDSVPTGMMAEKLIGPPPVAHQAPSILPQVRISQTP